MKRFAALGLVLLLLIAMAAGCTPSREALLRRGVEARTYDTAELCALLEAAVLAGEKELSLNYLGRRAAVERQVKEGLGEARESLSYIAGRFLSEASVTCLQEKGYVSAQIRLAGKEDALLADMPRWEGGGLSVEPYGAQALEALLMHMMVAGQPRALRLYEQADVDATNEALRRDLDWVMNNNYAYAYLVESAQWVLSEYTGLDGKVFLELDILLKFEPDTIPLADIPVVNDKMKIIEALVAGWAAGEEKVTLIVENLKTEEDEVFSWINTAEVNSATLACEGESVWYEIMETPGPRQIGRFWIGFDAQKADIEAAKVELDKALAMEGPALRAKLAGNSDPEAAYRAVFERVLERTEYDDEILEATEKEELTPRMQILRSAYGSLVAGQTVCTGYARAFQALCNELDLPCWTVSGTQKGEGHAWNMVRLHGEVLYVDCTFADTGGRPDKYFLFTQEQLEKWAYEIDPEMITPW